MITRRTLHSLLLLLVFIVLLVTPRNVHSCAYGPPEAVFTDARRPASLQRFAAGELGVIQPTYPRSMLFAAYRTLQGKPLSKDEQEHTLALWRHRIPSLGGLEQKELGKRWFDVRARVPGMTEVKKFDVYSYSQQSQAILNCTDDALTNAARTLELRIKKFGTNNPQIVDWVHAQDQVFSNCNQQEHAIPSPAPANFDPLIRSDREYQIAAANFYDHNWPAAIDGFNRIASDAASPWHGIAPYLAARALVRQSTLSVEEGFDPETMQRAEAAVKAILADKSRAAIHPAALRLQHFIDFRLHPKERLAELSRLIQSGQSTDLQQDLDDYTLLLDKFGEEEDPYRSEERQKALMAKRNAMNNAAADITDWFLTFQLNDTETRNHAVQKWQQTNSPAWLVAAISKFEPGDDAVQPLIDAALKLKPSSAAYTTTVYHALRILTVTRPVAARTRLDSLLMNSGPHLDRDALNLFYALRFRLARNLDELLTFAQRKPAVIDDNSWLESPQESKDPRSKTAFDVDSASTFNSGMPLTQLAAATKVKSLAPALRGDLALATWVRAVLLDQPDIANSIAPAVVSVAPQLKASIDAYQSATTSDARHFTAVLTLLRFPGLRSWVQPGLARSEQLNKIDSFRDNWWCSAAGVPNRDYPLRGTVRSVLPGVWEQGGQEAERTSDHDPDSPPQAPFPSFLSTMERKRATGEWNALGKVGPAPEYLGTQVIAWANSHADDSRVPEALHLAVRATRYGCTDTNTTRISKQAFELLHRRYPKSEWTARTRYYY